MPWAIVGLDKELGKSEDGKAPTARDVFAMDDWNLTILSWARMFLFASRDFWFEVPLPFYLRAPSCEGLGSTTCPANDCNPGSLCGVDGFCENINAGRGCGGLGVQRAVVGAVLGGYIILHGQVQSWTPQLVTGPLGQTPPNKLTEVLWGSINCLPTLVGGFALTYAPSFLNNEQGGMTAWLLTVIISYAFIFAINSSIHSFLVVNYAKSDKLAVSVGFYYMANALGRLTGTIGSGLLYTYVGEDYGKYAGPDATARMAACFFAGTCCSVMAAIM